MPKIRKKYSPWVLSVQFIYIFVVLNLLSGSSAQGNVTTKLPLSGIKLFSSFYPSSSPSPSTRSSTTSQIPFHAVTPIANLQTLPKALPTNGSAAQTNTRSFRPQNLMQQPQQPKVAAKQPVVAQQPSMLKLRAIPEPNNINVVAGMVIQPDALVMPLQNVRSIGVNSPGAGIPELKAAGSMIDYITVEANMPLSQVSNPSSPQSYMKRYPHAQYSSVDLPPLLPLELKERAAISLGRIDELFNRIEPEILKHGPKANGSASMHSSFGRPNTRAKQLSRSALVAVDLSRSLAIDYQLSREQIQYALPQISIYGTVLGDVCVLPPIPPCSCKPAVFREIDGFCNNPYHPEWGRSFTGFQRFLPPLYDDGVDSPRTHALSGSMLPSARLISTVIHPDVDRPHCHYTLLLMHFGQFMDHDINHTPSTTLTGYGKASNIQCCEIPHGLAGHPACFPIEIPPSDPYYAKYYLKCMNFVRSEAAPRPGCTLGPREQVNQLTSFLDGSQIYGSTYEDMKNIRLYQFGRLRTVFVDYCHKDVLPPDLETADCPDANATLPCFRAGDSRVNENTGLATLHTIFTREHNRIADELYYLNPYWDDERLFQEARKIVGALLQHILYNEWLPLVLGKDVMYQNDLLPTPSGYYGGYDKNINPTIANVFATAALRFGHTLIPSWFRFFNKYHEYIGQKQLRDAFFKPYPLYQPGIIDMYLLGMINDNVQKRDTFISSEVTEHLFEAMPTHGVDLAAINVQRGRDHGIPPYNAWREFCGLPKAYAFDDLKDVMRAEIVERFKTVYEHVEDIDLFPAGIAEEPLHDGLLGPTFTCILTKQFVHLKRGDRFWYENDVQPQAFTPDQLNAIRATSIARVICDNSDDIDTIQPKAFLHVLPSVNERVPCKGPFLPRLDLSAWKEISRETVELKGAVHEAVQDAVYPKPVTEPAYRK